LRRDIFLALALFAAACGDDSSSDDDSSKDDDSGSDESPQDAGQDSSQQTPDTGVADSGKDAETQSPALTEAQKTDGVVATQARAELLIAAFCAKAPVCGSSFSEAQCKTRSTDGWTNLVDNQVDDACKDAELDRYSCLSQADCDDLDVETPCPSFASTVKDLCPDDDAGMP
jgi:hypothetical protein